MGKKGDNRSRSDILVMLSFILLIVAAVLWILSALDVGLGDVGTILHVLVNIGLVLVVAMAAFPFASARKRSFWWFAYWVVVILALVGAVFGVARLF